jgi:phosphomannomutase
MSDLSEIVKAYDVRGTVPDQLNETVAAAIGAAFATVLRQLGEDASRVVIGHDMRESGPALVAAFTAGLQSEGVHVIHIGLCSTDQLYYASGALNMPGAMFTASHNPAEYNGIKLCRAGAKPIGQDSGLDAVRDHAASFLDAGFRRPELDPVEVRDLLGDYAAYLRSLVDLSKVRPLKVVVDAANGMGGHTVPAVLGDTVLDGLPLTIVPLYFELDGSFPNHEANPLQPANLVDLQKAVIEHGADIGLAFDGDADRCFVIDADGGAVSPSAITSLVVVRELAREPGATIIYNLNASRAVPEIIAEHGGVSVRTRCGHSFIKEEMARTGAIFGGEHSAHYYFRDFWGADTGMLAAMHVLAALGSQDAPLTELVRDYERYVASGEINTVVTDVHGKIVEVKKFYEALPQEELDGVTVTFPDGAWINLRPSNTEPLIRLNVEADTEERMAALRDEVLGLVRG